MSKSFWMLLLIVAIAFAIRFDLVIASDAIIDSDEAIVGLMARDILRGEPIPVFYYGQHYMGSFEALFASAFFWIGGMSTLALKMVPLFFSLLVVVLVFHLGELLMGRRGAILAAIFMAVPPSPLVVWSSMARGGFIEVVALGVLSLVLLVRWIRNPRPLTLLVLSFVLGLGWWVNNQILYFMLPTALAGLALVLRPGGESRAQILRSGLCGALGFFAGSFPYWWYQFRHNFPARAMFAPVNAESFFSHVQGVVGSSFPALLGAKHFWGENELFPGAVVVVCGLYLLLLTAFLCFRGARVRAACVIDFDRRQPLELLLVIIPFAALVFSLSPFGFLVTAPRYLLPLYPVIFVLAAYVIDQVWHGRAVLGRLLALALLSANLYSSFGNGRAIPGQPFVYDGERVSEDHHQLLAWLKDHDVRVVRTNYWIGYRLAFESNERVIFSLFQQPSQVRIQRYEDEAAKLSSADLPYVLTSRQAVLVKRALEIEGYTFREAKLSGYHVLYDVEQAHRCSQPVPSSALMVTATHGQESSRYVIDGDPETRWGSAAPQQRGMELAVSVDAPRVICGFSIDMGRWPQDYPRGMQIDWVDPSGLRQNLFNVEDVAALRYFTEGRPLTRYWFPQRAAKSLVFQQVGSHPVFDWSAAEISLFQP